jgi:DNA-binding XRE family transcriptional regulator
MQRATCAKQARNDVPLIGTRCARCEPLALCTDRSYGDDVSMAHELDISVETLTRCLAGVLEKKRQSLAISQEELARRAGLSRTYLSDIERGLRNISVVTLTKIATAMGTNASLVLAEAEMNSFPIANVSNTRE